ILQEAVADPDLDRLVREVAAGTIIHTILPQEGDAPGRYVQVDIGAHQNLFGFHVVWPTDAAHAYTILASADGTVWTNCLDAQTTGGSGVVSRFVPNVRYVRFVDKTGSGLASFEIYGAAPPAAVSAAPGQNLLQNPNFEASSGTDILNWSKRPITDTNAAQTGTSGNNTYSSYNVSHGTIGDRYAYLYAAAPYSASVYQTVTGIPNGIYEFRGWVKRGHPSAGVEQAELYAYAENYGGETIVNNLLQTVPRTEASYADNTGNTVSGRYPYTEIVIDNIHVTNGQATIGFFANAPNNVSASPNYAFIDDLSLVLVSGDPAYPTGDETYNALVDVGRVGDGVTAAYRVASAASAGPALAVIAAYDAGGALVAFDSRVLPFTDGEITFGSLSLDGYRPEYAYAAFLWDADTYVPLMDKAPLSVKRIDPVTVFPFATDGYTLPDTVTVRYHDSPNGVGELPVVWSRPGPFTEIGVYEVEGVVYGTDIPAVAHVTVKGDNLLLNAALDDWSSSNGSPDSWTRSSTTSNRFSRDAGVKNQHTSGSGTHYSAAYYLAGAAGGSYVALYQTVDLQPGQYVLSCFTQGLIIPGSTGDIRLYHAAGTTEPTGQSDPITTYNGVGDWQYPTYTFEVTTAGRISVGVRGSLNNGTWLQVDDFALCRIG
ncbi:MAG: discoidin domain-containing protein, partial [Oscillospiraceae bacterium]|nr:discoidin domain-containing protein [Oscillospiraceae bacterium]